MRKKILICNRTLTVDPGWHTGWAWWTVPSLAYRESDKKKDADNCLTDLGVFNVSRAKGIKTTVDRINYMGDQFERLVNQLMPEMVWIEGTAVWSGSLKSMTAAKRGDIMTLSYLVGTYIRVCSQYGAECDLVTAPEWKGQMTDEMVACKVEEVTDYGLDDYPQHTLDAVGIGLSGFGVLENKVKYNRRRK